MEGGETLVRCGDGSEAAIKYPAAGFAIMLQASTASVPYMHLPNRLMCLCHCKIHARTCESMCFMPCAVFRTPCTCSHKADCLINSACAVLLIDLLGPRLHIVSDICICCYHAEVST